MTLVCYSQFTPLGVPVSIIIVHKQESENIRQHKEHKRCVLEITKLWNTVIHKVCVNLNISERKYGDIRRFENIPIKPNQADGQAACALVLSGRTVV